MEHVYFADRHCLADRRGVYARVLDRGRIAKFGGNSCGVHFVERISTRGVVGLLCDWLVDRSFIAATCHGLVAIFARAKHVGLCAWIRLSDHSALAVIAPKHVDGGGHDVCYVVGCEFGVGLPLEYQRNLD